MMMMMMRILSDGTSFVASPILQIYRVMPSIPVKWTPMAAVHMRPVYSLPYVGRSVGR